MLGVMVVVVMREIFSTYMVQNIDILRDEDRVSAVKLDIESLIEALKLYRLDNQCYPATEQGLQALSSRRLSLRFQPTGSRRISQAPAQRPLGQSLQYLNPVCARDRHFQFGC